MRLRMDLGYDGTDFHGWAAQKSAQGSLRTVQGVLEEALATVLRQPVSVTCAGRTDTGVHARGQVVHLDTASEVVGAAAGRARDPLASLVRRLNGVLPDDVRVHGLAEAPPAFNARFAATSRRYAYRIADDPAAVDPLARRFVLAWPRPLDVTAMNQAATMLLGMHDFAAFCKRREGATTIRTLLELGASRDATGVVETTVRADAFCHHMVRSLLGCLVAVGEGRYEPEWARRILDARERDPRVAVLPASGLTLEEVTYPPDELLAARVEEARAVRSHG